MPSRRAIPASAHAALASLERNGLTAAVCRLFDFLSDVQFWIKDRDGRYCSVNRGFLLNYAVERADDVLGKTDYELSPKHLADQFRQDDEMVLRGQPVIHRLELVGRFDHTASWSATTKIPIHGPRSAIVGTAGITTPLSGETAEAQETSLAVGKAIAFVRQSYPRLVGNDELAAVSGLSVRAFERQFRRGFRLSPQQYIKRLRVRMACYDLVYTARALADIAAAHGFCDQSHFSREFRRQVGMTPRQYRRRFQAAADA
jgi:AraC-like DNA-binding protein